MQIGKVVVALVALAVVAAGLAVPPPADEAMPTEANEASSTRLDRAVRAWDFSGFSGNLSWSNTSIGWIDIAWPVTDNTSVQVSYRRHWGPEDTDDDGAAWLCSSHGLAAHPRRYDALGMGHCRWSLQDDNETGVSVRAARRTHEASAPTPAPTWYDGADESGSGVVIGNWTKGARRPVVHHTVFMGGGQPEVFKLWFNYTNTTPRVRTGPPSDTFAYTVEDFNSTAYAQVKAPTLETPTTSSAATLQVPMVREKPSTVWAVWPTAVGENVQTNWTRPDGSQDGTDLAWIEATRMAGPWQFEIADRASAYGDGPVLMGASYHRASFPWQSPIFG